MVPYTYHLTIFFLTTMYICMYIRTYLTYHTMLWSIIVVFSHLHLLYDHTICWDNGKRSYCCSTHQNLNVLVSEQLFHQSLIFFRNVTPKKCNTRRENTLQFWVLINETEWSEMEAENRKECGEKQESKWTTMYPPILTNRADDQEGYQKTHMYMYLSFILRFFQPSYIYMHGVFTQLHCLHKQRAWTWSYIHTCIPTIYVPVAATDISHILEIYVPLLL